MNIPMSWLKEYVDIDTDIQTFTDKMIMSGSNVEGYKELGEEISKVIWGQVTSVENHPDADKLRIMMVDINAEDDLQIVTAAANVDLYDVIPVAIDGASLPGGMEIKAGELRGVKSEGMMCSVNELGFESEDIEDAPEDGVYVAKKEVSLGEDVKPFFGLDDIIVEYEITSDRPDCFSILGLAREAAATFNTDFKFPQVEVEEIAGKASEMAEIEIEDKELCPRFAARIIKDVKVQDSPAWLKRRLISAGLRPVNNIVDITNYILLEFGQPMHAYDYDKLEDKKIIVRQARQGESLDTLLGDKVKLSPNNLVIADTNKPIGIAGIVGGEDTKVTEDTKNILFECANFNGPSIRKSSKELAIMSDASIKFTKGLDPNNVEKALDRAAHLIVETGAGQVVEGLIDEYPNKREPVEISYDYKEINKFLGTDISKEEMENYFERLEFKVHADNNMLTIPTFRSDINIMADLAEEVARLYGYDKIEPTLERATPTVGLKTRDQQLTDKVKSVMSAEGVHEALTYSFESPKIFDNLNISEDSDLRDVFTISNPLGQDFSIMRTTTVNGILKSLATNYNRRVKSAGLYEIGRVFLKVKEGELPDERKKLTIGIYGENEDFYSLKGRIETLLGVLRCEDKISYKRNEDASWLHPGRSADMLVKDEVIGYFGEVHPVVARNYDIGTRVYFAEIDIEKLFQISKLDGEYKELARYPSTSRDIAFLVKEEVLAGDIAKLIKEKSGKFLEELELFDVYHGEQVKDGFKSMAYNISFRSREKTLKEKQVKKIMEEIIEALETEFQAVLRDQ